MGKTDGATGIDVTPNVIPPRECLNLRLQDALDMIEARSQLLSCRRIGDHDLAITIGTTHSEVKEPIFGRSANSPRVATLWRTVKAPGCGWPDTSETALVQAPQTSHVSSCSVERGPRRPGADLLRNSRSWVSQVSPVPWHGSGWLLARQRCAIEMVRWSPSRWVNDFVSTDSHDGLVCMPAYE